MKPTIPSDEFIPDSPGEPAPIDPLGQAESFLAFQEQLSLVARVERPVLLVGERGTGKELAARRLHFLSKRWREPLVALNCAALAPSLIESELFGHERGAFTGAIQRRTGRFESADNGTLFLDEIGNIPIETQEKILRFVEYGGFERVGGTETVRADVRIVGATNSDLLALAAEGRFMRDLLDRLSFEVLFLPPLRARVDDILLLANHFAARMAHELDWAEMPEITPAAAALLESYPWPGNVRELKNVVERAVYKSTDTLITSDEIIFDPFQSPYAPRTPHADAAAPLVPSSIDASADRFTSFEEAVRDFEVALLGRALRRAQRNQNKAAALLGLSYHQFRGLYRKHRDRLDVS